MQVKRPRSLKEHEDLTYNDLWCRIKEARPELKKMYMYPGIILSVWSEWHEQRVYFFSLYARIDKNKNGRCNQQDVVRTMKNAMKEYKKKH